MGLLKNRLSRARGDARGKNAHEALEIIEEKISHISPFRVVFASISALWYSQPLFWPWSGLFLMTEFQ